ncbi:MAG: T9SS type A sorting domain-containing protein, partial [candidate division Zixibacteria bacterium]|nr:T9SS type A sorting domain-containing protein [candidate division Zixibacteria bacterium]
EGGLDPAPQSVSVTNVGTGTLDWTATYDAAWITVAPLSGTAPSSIDIGTNIDGLVSGTYIDTVTITAVGALNSPQYVVVTLNLNPPSSQGGDTVWVSSESILVGQQATVEIDFTNDNLISGIQIPLHFDPAIVVCDSVSFTGSRVENVDMLLSPIDSVEGTVNIGVVPTESDLIPTGSGLMARLYFTGLAAGFSSIDTGFIAPASEYVFVDEDVQPFYPVFDAGGVDVTEPTAPCIEVDPDTVIFEAVQNGPNPADQTIIVTNCGVGELNWTVSVEFGTWLSITPVSGGDGDLITLSVSIDGLSPGDYSENIAIADPNAFNSPVVVPVYLTVQEPGPARDTVRVESVTVITSPTDPVVFDVPVTLFTTDSVSAASLGLYYNSNDIVIDSISLSEGVASGTVPYNVIDPDNNLAAIGFTYFPGIPGAHPVYPGDGLLARLWFTLSVGAPEQVIEIDSGFFPPAGDFILTSYAGFTIHPEFKGGTITVTSGGVPGEIAGTIVDSETELPIADAVVELYNMFPGTPIASTVSSMDGSFLFVDVTPGDYVIRAYKEGYYPANLEYTFAKEPVVLMLVPVQEIIETYEWVNFFCDNNYLDGELILPGDVIEAYDPTGVLCGQFFVTELGKYGFMPVYRDDEFTDPYDEGCEPGDTVSFTINGYPAETSADAIWTENGDNWEVCLNAQSIVTKCFELQEGWQLISWNVDTEVDDIEILIAGIKSSIDVILSFETGALTYDPGLPDFNTLSEMDHFHGYWFRMLEPATFCVTGPPVDPTTPIALEAGWNLSSYLPNQQDSVEHALQSIMDYLLAVLAFYDGGVTYDPNLGEFSTLQVMMPMFGYWIKVTDDIMLTYPGEAGPTFAKSVPDVFSDDTNPFGMRITNRWIDMFGSGVTVDGKLLSAGTIIEAIDDDGVVCGTFTVERPGMFGFMPVYGAEDGSIDGLNPGDEFNLRLNGRESEETFVFGEEGDRIMVTSLHLKAGSSNTVPDRYSLSQNYPNPFNPETVIAFELPADSKVELTIYNILGEKVATLVNEFKAAGAYEVTWNGTRDDGSTVSSGIYFYRLRAGDYAKSMKMTLMK